MNIFDYLKWRDDILFEELNEADIIVFNRIAYFPLENIIKKDETISICNCYLRSLKVDNLEYSNKNDLELFKVISKSDRYKDLELSSMDYKFSKNDEQQFFAITINLGNDHCYVSFRGTTGNIVGWKENFNMSVFSVVPSQRDALIYLNKVRYKYIYVGGHSKGGNLAIYASIHAKKEIKEKIINVYNYDGPGFMVLLEDYYSFKDKIISYIPEYSVVGRLLNLDNKTVVVKSNAKKIFQHDIYTWKVEKKYLLRGQLNEESDTLKKIIDEWIIKMDTSSRYAFINSIYKIIESSGVEDVKDININDIKEFLLSYKNMSSDNKRLIFKLLGYFFDSFKENIDI